MRTGVLYISYDGMLEPLGQSQVLAYQERLAPEMQLHLLSFEKPEDWKNLEARTKIARRMSEAGIFWHPCRYHRRPSAVATAYDILAGITVGLYLIMRYRLRIVHARSYVSSVMALALKRLVGTKFIFDMRGFWADERVDGRLWARESRMYQLAKWFERRFLLSADHVVSLTYAAVSEMSKFPYLRGKPLACSVIPTCADLTRFQPARVERDGFVLGYIGSAGTWYLFDEVVNCFARLRLLRPDARFLIINRNEHGYIRERLAVGGVPNEAVELLAADHAEMPQYINRMHAVVFFVKQAFSKQASAPTKLGELLGCGIPCLANTGVGDMAAILTEERVGVALEYFTPSAMDAGLRELLDLANEPDSSARCVKAAHKYFSLDRGVESYRKIYKALAAES